MVANSPQPISSPSTPTSDQSSSYRLFTSISAISSIGIHKDHGEDTFQVLHTIMPETLENVVHFDDRLSNSFQYFSITRSFTPNRMGVTPGEISQHSFTDFIEKQTHPDMTTEEWRKFWLEFMQETDKKVNHWIGTLNNRGNIGCSFLGLILDRNHYSALNVGSNVLYLYRDGICRQPLQIQAFAADDEDDRPARYFGTHAGWKEWRLQNGTYGELKDGDIFILGTNSFFRFGGDLVDLGFQLKKILPLDSLSSPHYQPNVSQGSSGSPVYHRESSTLDEGKTSLFLLGTAAGLAQNQPTQVLASHPGEQGKTDLTLSNPFLHPLATPQVASQSNESKKGQDLSRVLFEIYEKTRAKYSASDLTLMAIQVSLQTLPAAQLKTRIPPPLSLEKSAQKGEKRGQDGRTDRKVETRMPPYASSGASPISQDEALQAMWALGLKKAVMAFMIGLLLGLFLIALWSLAFL